MAAITLGTTGKMSGLPITFLCEVIVGLLDI
jgi:hypothetical protein